MSVLRTVNLLQPRSWTRNSRPHGGLQPWRAVQTMTLSGKLGASGNQRAALPVPNLGRPDRGIRELVASRPADEVQLPL
jgi:hypothetical protein